MRERRPDGFLEQFMLGLVVALGVRIVVRGGATPQMKPAPSGRIQAPVVSNSIGNAQSDNGAFTAKTVRLRGDTGSAIPRIPHEPPRESPRGNDATVRAESLPVRELDAPNAPAGEEKRLDFR